ncbi:MAG TPA: TetR/AcrR family transcriptional regulator [Phenylobacterium sp.]
MPLQLVKSGADGGAYQINNAKVRLFKEAREILETEGLEALSLRALANRVGITPGAMYHHYDSKSALLAELAVCGFDEMRAQFVGADAHAPIGGRLRAWAVAYVAFAARQPAFYSLMFDPRIGTAPQVRVARERAFAALETLLASVVVQQARESEPVDKIAVAVWAAAHGAASLTINGGGEQLIHDVIRGLEDLYRPAPPIRA